MRTSDGIAVQLAQRKLADAVTVVEAATFGGAAGHSVPTRVFAHKTRMVAYKSEEIKMDHIVYMPLLKRLIESWYSVLIQAISKEWYPVVGLNLLLNLCFNNITF